MQNDTLDLSFCPSFNSYSSDSNKLVDIADSVSRDFKTEVDFDDEEFEFVNGLSESNETSSFPIFNRDLLLNGGDDDVDDVEEAICFPLRNLLIRDGDFPSSSSEGEDDDSDGELKGIPEEMYCIWKPRQSVESSSPNKCKKSNSTGSSSSKRWRLIKDLLKRSNSDSKVSSTSLLDLNFDKNNEEKARYKTAKMTMITTITKKKKKEVERVQATKEAEKASAHAAFYVRSKALKEGDKRQSYLPYRRDLVGIFANVHGFGRTFSPF